MAQEKPNGRKGMLRRRVIVFVMPLVTFIAGLAVGRYVLTSTGPSVAKLAEGTVMVERYARGLGRAMVYGATAVLCTAILAVAYVLKPRGRKD